MKQPLVGRSSILHPNKNTSPNPVKHIDRIIRSSWIALMVKNIHATRLGWIDFVKPCIVYQVLI